MMWELTSLIPRPHPAFCAIHMLIVFLVCLQESLGTRLEVTTDSLIPAIQLSKHSTPNYIPMNPHAPA